MERTIDKYLSEWKNSPSRLVLLLRGARQVGKTYSIRALGATFPRFLEINFEAQAQARFFFEGDLNIAEICEKLAAYTRVPIVQGETLIFFDEVQACPNCLRALRFFHENMPGLHVVAAGSLLEFALAEIPSFGVGRIESLFMYPLSLMEFLRAEGSALLVEYIGKNNGSKPIDLPFHTRLLERLRTYMLIGGMPAVVDAYCRQHDLLACQDMINNLLTSLVDDFAKYEKHVAPRVLRNTFRYVSRQAGGKFMYAAVGEDISSREIKSALDALERAGLIYRIYHTAARGIPLGAQTNDRRFKIIPFDVGLHQRMLGLNVSDHLVMSHESLVNRGSIAEVFAGLEMIACGPAHRPAELYYWHREQRDSNAEVDYVVQRAGHIIPVEVKSGTHGRMQSMHIFLAERSLPLGVRLSQENISRLDTIMSLPLYMAGMVPEKIGVI